MRYEKFINNRIFRIKIELINYDYQDKEIISHETPYLFKMLRS